MGKVMLKFSFELFEIGNLIDNELLYLKVSLLCYAEERVVDLYEWINMNNAKANFLNIYSWFWSFFFFFYHLDIIAWVFQIQILYNLKY